MTEELETLAPLKVTRTMASPEDDRHCFKFHSRQVKEDAHCDARTVRRKRGPPAAMDNSAPKSDP